MMELLSPAGSMDALRAAVQNGADAVYLGSGVYNARAGAKNFTLDELREAVRYCHVRGVRVHFTVNTLTTDREAPQIEELVRQAAKAGVDAFIVQDPGTVQLCRRLAPSVEVHASTQMSIHNLDGVLQAAKMGCSRVVLARELRREDIAYICKNSPIEIEVFAHGALCMCYSGQCYLSAVIGRRSGNRGQCAQPCRLPYGYGRREERYPLSLRDNCLVTELNDLQSLGVASIKLEGRMKRPEYVAIVTRIYRTALSDGRITEENKRRLERVFSRQGFTQGYYFGRTGPEMFGVREDIKTDRELLAQARETYERSELARVGVVFYALLRAGKPAQLAVEDPEGRRCMTEGPVPETAQIRELKEEELVERLKKTGGTPYFCKKTMVSIEPGITLSAAAINTMRRDLLTELTALRGQAPEVKLHLFTRRPPVVPPKCEPVHTVCVQQAQQLTQKLLDSRPEVLYVPLSELIRHPELQERIPQETELCALLPRVIFDSEQARLEKLLGELKAAGIGSVLCGNAGHVAMARRLGFAVRGDFGLNIFSSAAMEYWQEEGLSSATVSFEATLAQIRDLSKPLPCEMLIYGRLPLMLTENCLIRARSGVCACDGAVTRLVDRRGAEFPVLPDPGTCRSVLYNGKKLWLLDRQRELAQLGIRGFRLQFTTENPHEVDLVLSQYAEGGAFDAGVCTRGLYLRGGE